MPKKFNNVYFNGECLDGFHIVDTKWDKEGICRTCGKPFIGQVFCSRKCVSQYKNRMNKMKEIYGKEFEDWLDDGIDYTYSPEKHLFPRKVLIPITIDEGLVGAEGQARLCKQQSKKQNNIQQNLYQHIYLKIIVIYVGYQGRRNSFIT